MPEVSSRGMKSKSLLVSGVLLFLALHLPAQCHGQTNNGSEKKVVPLEGTQAFQYLVHLAGLEPLPNLQSLQDVPAHKTVIVVMGDPAPLTEIETSLGGSLRSFLRAGGALLVATERRTPPSFYVSLGLRVDGTPLKTEMWQREPYYKEIPSCPLITTFEENNHPLVNKCKRIATNLPSWFTYDQTSGWRPLVLSSRVTRKSNRENLIAYQEFPSGDLPGRAVVISGQGLFLNGMMVQKDTDNFVFAYNCVNWLSADGKRTRVLFIEEGKNLETLDVPLTVSPPSIVPSVELTNKVLNSLQEKIDFNAIFLQYMSRGQLWLSLLFSMGLFALVRLVAQLIKFRYKFQTNVPLSSDVLERTTSLAPPLAVRNQEMYQKKNLWEPLRHLARHWFETLTESLDPVNSKPRVKTKNVFSRWVWQRRLDYLWKLAFGTSPIRISPGKFARALRIMEAIDEKRRGGSITFAK
ncbi:MAG: hypothetical protein ACFCD0_29390 [Gemmataceae bacterium]